MEKGARVNQTNDQPRERFGPEHWDDWRWHMTHAVRTLEGLSEWIDVTDDERRAIENCADRYRWSITPYYASLMDPDDANCPVRRQAVPALEELSPSNSAQVDPVGDREFLVTRRVVHKYRDRVIMLVTDRCPVYCRHCTRKFHTTDLHGTYFGEGSDSAYADDFEYLRQHPEVRDVLLTGGDPLTLGDGRLERILSGLRRIPHLEILRLGSRYPVLLPQRITVEFCQMLERYAPLYLNTHFNHPREITPAAAAACDRLLRHGIVVQNQTVLLKGINDDPDTMLALVRKLLEIRVLPYYLYHCDDVEGVSHFMTSIERGREIMRAIIGHTTGFAAPRYVITTPLGKIPISDDNLEIDGDCVRLTNYRGERLSIVNPVLAGQT